MFFDKNIRERTLREAAPLLLQRWPFMAESRLSCDESREVTQRQRALRRSRPF